MDHVVRLFEIAKGAKVGDAPVPIKGFAVSAETLDDARRAVLSRLMDEHREVRSLSFAEDGGLVAVVYPPDEVTPVERPSRRRRGR